MARLMSSKFPLVVVLTEMAAQLRDRRAELHLEWVPRNQNEEADALTNGRFEAFREEHRIQVDIRKLGFKVLDEMIQVADQLYSEVKARKEIVITPGDQQASERPAKARRKSLKEREPW